MRMYQGFLSIQNDVPVFQSSKDDDRKLWSKTWPGNSPVVIKA